MAGSPRAAKSSYTFCKVLLQRFWYGTRQAIYPEPQMRPTEPQMPKTEQLRRGLIQRAARLLRQTEDFVQDALVRLRSGCTPAKRRFLIKEISEMQRRRRQLRRNIKRGSG